MKYALLLAATILMTTGCAGMKDLRGPALSGVQELPVDRVREGRKLLAAMMEAHGGKQRWKSLRTAVVDMRDDWPNPVTRWAASPWADNDSKMRVSMRLGRDLYRLDFLEGQLAGSAWGIQQWVTYQVNSDNELRFGKDRDVWFWVPTMGYFFEAPFRLADGEYIASMGEAKAGGKTYDRVFITWGSVEPDAKIDQYVAWISRETGLLTYLEYTVRDVTASFYGCMHYSKYHEVDGIQVARSMMTVDGPGSTSNSLHEIKVDAVDFGVTLPDVLLLPDPKRRATKSDEGG